MSGGRAEARTANIKAMVGEPALDILGIRAGQESSEGGGTGMDE